MRRILFTLMSLACSVAVATTVYRWVDENGVVHYSDQPYPNAQKLQVEGVQTYPAGHPPGQTEAPAQEPQGAPANPYRGCAISHPSPGQTIDNADSVVVSVQTDPATRGGDQIFLMMDGQLLNGGAATGRQFNITPLDRGQHTLQAVVRGAGGQVLCESPTITFFVHQPSLVNPVNPVRPH